MQLAPLDWLIVGSYLVASMWIGLVASRRAGESVDEFFLSGRRLPWWIAGTSMIATSFAADTPLVVTGWVRDFGIWQNWQWWCFATSGFLGTFLFARYWRRGAVMTTAELAELRYGGKGAAVLRGVVGFYHAFVKNELVLAWVLLAGMKIMDVLVGGHPLVAIVVLCLIALAYSTSAGLLGVVLTDLPQFVLTMVGAIVLAVIVWSELGGIAGVLAGAGDAISPETVALLPPPGPGGPFDASFWTAPVAALAIFLCVQWWANENVDGGPIAVQRIAAAKDERHGMLAFLWFNVAHYALRPWPWIAVALASLAVLPPIVVRAPVAGEVGAASATAIEIRSPGGGEVVTTVRLDEHADPYWRPRPIRTLAEGEAIAAGAVLARTDSERAYPAMMAKYLPVGLLGLVVASLLAAFMSTVDTHVNLASSFFVNDIYRRFVRRDAGPGHYVLVARLAGVGVLALGAFVAWQADSIAKLFTLFLSLLSGIGPVYVLRWLWWRVKASTELTAMAASWATTLVLSLDHPRLSIPFAATALSPGGELSDAGRIAIVVLVSLAAALVSLAVTARPDPRSLVAFYRRVRPLGAWGPVRELAPDVVAPRDGWLVLVAILGGIAATYGAMFALGLFLLARGTDAWVALVVAAAGTSAVVACVPRLTRAGSSPAP